MKVAIPTTDDRGVDSMVFEHFGKAPYYTVVDTETGQAEAEPNRGQHCGGTQSPAELISESGVNAVFCANLGRRAVKLFGDEGILVFWVAQGNVKGALEDYSAGRLQRATEEGACSGRHTEEDEAGSG